VKRTIFQDDAERKRIGRLRDRYEDVHDDHYSSVLADVVYKQNHGIDISEVGVLPWVPAEELYHACGSPGTFKEFIEMFSQKPYVLVDRKTRIGKPMVRFVQAELSKTEKLKRCARIARMADRACEVSSLRLGLAVLDQVTDRYNNWEFTPEELTAAIREMRAITKEGGDALFASHEEVEVSLNTLN
jgi:hypothetical protein